MGLLASKIDAGFLISPWMTVTFGFEASHCALLASRVRARIWNGALLAMRASITAPPCFPVAPVIKIFLEFGTGGMLDEFLMSASLENVCDRLIFRMNISEASSIGRRMVV